ncbi:GGDEF domain-containing protein [Mangrovibacillus cuniculi]|uniref:GGDEF domain-containing protein n=1 Tax=Mangrovibacillus cuniculi TaxID=2593652 RepID=A0A7S8HF37_9BACI|nr:GGDEF domain-containing protein [Mangrovibacillus cuniculi]QPC46116.1 GGDEF domain-containing protein [Mangrovibacillus cuniculi]
MNKIYLSDHKTEFIFSMLRWIFLVIAIFLFYVPVFYENLPIIRESFTYLLILGFIYMTVTQVVLQKKDLPKHWFKKLAGAGVVFDFLAMFWLFFLTGGVMTFLFPIAYFLVMHATIYWRMKGAFISSVAISLGYIIVYLLNDTDSYTELFILCLNICFMWLIGLFGSLIVIRERYHLGEKERAIGLLAIDYLTNLYNHRTFQEDLREFNHKKEPFYLVLGDIDYFKQTNDQYGHVVGDELLKSLGVTFSELMKRYACRAYRYGGEEFAFLVDGNIKIDVFMKDMYRYIQNTEVCSKDIIISMSFGVERGPTTMTPTELVDRADQLLYKAKNMGKNQAVLYNEVTVKGS